MNAKTSFRNQVKFSEDGLHILSACNIIDHAKGQGNEAKSYDSLTITVFLRIPIIPYQQWFPIAEVMQKSFWIKCTYFTAYGVLILLYSVEGFRHLMGRFD